MDTFQVGMCSNTYKVISYEPGMLIDSTEL